MVYEKKSFGVLVFIFLTCCIPCGCIAYLIYYAFKSKECPMCKSSNLLSQEPQQVQQVPQQQLVVEEIHLNYCSYCGLQKNQKDAFCVHCGEKG